MIRAHWHNDRELFCCSFLYFLRCFRTHRRIDSCFLLRNLATRSACYFVCFCLCDASNRLRNAATRSPRWFQSFACSSTQPTRKSSNCICKSFFHSTGYWASRATNWSDFSATFTVKRSITVCIWICKWILSSDIFVTRRQVLYTEWRYQVLGVTRHKYTGLQ